MPARLVKDVRALGAGALPRAAYEASKRTGAHRFLFSTVSKGSPVRAVGTYRVPLLDSAAAQLALADARDILNIGALAFGRRFPLNSPSDWTADPQSGLPWPQVSWWNIDIRTDRRLGDVKWVWELGRHRDLVVLARAAALEPEQSDWLESLDRLITWWCEANPLEHSIHWYSNLELSLRLFAWDQILGLVGDRLPERTLDLMGLHVAQMRRHLWRDLPYTLSSMRNNHMLGDALGLGLAEGITGRPRSGMRWDVAARMWRSQLARQVNPDGSMIEDSVSYHRFVLEMLCARAITGDRSPELITAIRSSSRYLADLGALEGPVPQYGDWDEGRVLASSGDPLDVGNSAALGLALSGEAVDPRWWDRFDLLSWYAPETQVTSDALPVAASRRVGDIAVARQGPWQVWLKCGAGPSHGHADLGHVSVRYRDQWLLTDPGTGTYNGPLAVRNGFRVSTGHNVLRPLGAQQIEPHRAFRWMSTPRGRAGKILETAGATILWGAHDAFVRPGESPWPWRLARTVVVTDGGVTVVDWREDDSGAAFDLTVPLSSDCSFEKGVITLGGEQLPIVLPGASRVSVGSEEPFLGWESRTYGLWEPAPWLVVTGATRGPLVWSVGHSVVEVEGDLVRVGGVELSVTWDPRSAKLSVSSGSDTMADEISLGRAT